MCGEEAGLVRCPRGGRVVPGQPAGTVLSVGEWVLRERFATDAGEIAWDRLGKGPPVVLVHGTPWSSWTWRAIAPRLAERFTVYVFDLLGFGASDKRPGQVSLAAHGARLAALLRYWQLNRPALIAHDIGGATALRAHLVHHRSVAALGLWGPPRAASHSRSPGARGPARRVHARARRTPRLRIHLGASLASARHFRKSREAIAAKHRTPRH